MSGESAGSSAAQRAASGASRVAKAWRALPHERRLAAYAALGLFFTLFLPWYQETVIVPSKTTHLQAASATLTGWGAFSFVEAAVLLVAAGVLTLLFQRAEGRAFHLPGGDGGVITAAGVWTCVLVIWRIFDKQGTSSHGQLATTSGIEWGIFIALAVAVFLTYSGSRIRAAHRPEPPLPGEKGAAAAAEAEAATAAEPIRPRSPRKPSGTRDDPEKTQALGAPEARRRRRPASLSAPENADATLPRPAEPDPAERPTLRRRPSSQGRDLPPAEERDTEPQTPPEDQLTIPFEPHDEG